MHEEVIFLIHHTHHSTTSKKGLLSFFGYFKAFKISENSPSAYAHIHEKNIYPLRIDWSGEELADVLQVREEGGVLALPAVRSRVAGAQVRRGGQADPPEDMRQQEVQESVLEQAEEERKIEWF